MSISEAFRSWLLQPLVRHMSQLQDEVNSLGQEVAGLKTAIADAVTRVTTLQQAQSAKIDELTALLAQGGAPQEVIDQLEAIKADAVAMHGVVDALDPS